MRIKLRLEPYDPDARDADGDGIVQEGTAWERPAGAKILDDLGNEIKRGLTSPYRNTSWKLVDKDGNDLNYRPTYGNDADLNPKDAKPTLEKLGYRTIEQMGIPTVKDLVLPSTKPTETIEAQDEPPPSSPLDVLDNIGPTSSAEGRLWNLVEGDDDQTFTRDGFYYIQNGDLDGLLDMANELYGSEMEDDEQITLNDVLAVFRDRRDSARYTFRSQREIRLWRSGNVGNTRELVSFTSDRSEAEEFGDEPIEYIVPVDAIYSEGHASYDGELLIDQSMARLASEQDSETNESMQDNLSSLFDELREEGDGWLAGSKEAGELMRQWEEGELPEDFDDSMLDEQMFAIGEEAREARFQRLEYTVSPEGAETLRVWIDGRDGATYSIRDEIEDRFLKSEDRAGQLADLVSTDRNSDAWKQEYESQLSRIQRIQSRSDGVESLLEMIDNSPIQEQPLYRGMMLSPEQLDKLVQSGRINFPVGATSSSRNSALEYAGRGGNQSVVFEIEGARAFPAHLFSRVDENEFLVSGEFEIVNVGQEDSPFGSVSVVKIRPTGRTYREHGRELLSGRDSDVVTPDGPDLHVQEIQAKQSADEASRLIAKSQPDLTPEQQETVSEVTKLVDAMKSIGVSLTEDEFKEKYGVTLARGAEVLLEDFGPDDDMSLLYVSRLFPSELVGRDGSTYTSKYDYIEIRPNYVLVEGNIYDASGKYVGEYSRRLRIDADKKLVAHHIVLDISEERRNAGIGTAFNTEMERLYRNLGVDRIEVDAASSIRYEGDEQTPMDIQRGVSFWPRQGFDWQDDRSRQVAIQLFERLIDKPERVYIEGVSNGPRPTGTDRFDIAYFASAEEWETFVDAFQRTTTTSFDDPGRPVAGDLMRWNGADEWVARRSAGYNPTYVKKLNQPESIGVDDAQLSALSRAKELDPEKIRSATSVGQTLTLGSTSEFDFGFINRQLLQDIEDGVEVEDEQLFGLEIIKLFDGSFTTRDGTSYAIQVNDVYGNVGNDSAFYMTGVITNESGDVASFVRTIRVATLPDGTKKITAEHDELVVADNHRGKGVASSFNAEFEKIYIALGVDEVILNGLSGGSGDSQYIGATHWPRSGFDWGSDFSKDEFLRVLDELVIFDDDTDTYAPSGIAYVEGLSSGERPIGPDRRTVAYFSSVEEWETFIELFEQSRGEWLSDENRVVAGDLVRWDGADDWFAGGEYSFDYTKKLKES